MFHWSTGKVGAFNLIKKSTNRCSPKKAANVNQSLGLVFSQVFTKFWLLSLSDPLLLLLLLLFYDSTTCSGELQAWQEILSLFLLRLSGTGSFNHQPQQQIQIQCHNDLWNLKFKRCLDWKSKNNKYLTTFTGIYKIWGLGDLNGH